MVYETVPEGTPLVKVIVPFPLSAHEGALNAPAGALVNTQDALVKLRVPVKSVGELAEMVEDVVEPGDTDAGVEAESA